ncbi:hypothetical protein Q0M94_08865 [Deinococcus radiomollis]|uniref:hypothetical protein n=1 Tax=Deinococcus radiomollis TaxID=468916 RepID=UPI0038920117
MLDSVSWIVHPLAGMTLAFLASVIFNRQRRQWPVVLGAVGLLLVLSVLGADWVVHPAAGLSIALLASTVFHAWRREWKTVLAAVLALLVFSALGAGWAVFPLMGLGLAWLMKVVFSGELFRAAPQERSAAFLAGTPAALPAQGGGEAFAVGAFSVDTVQERVTARAERRVQKRVAKLERKAERLGLPLRVSLEKSPSEPVAAALPAAIPAPAGGLLALSRDERLPDDARARLGALHFRCREALDYLKAHGQDGAGPGFLLRQIETDYAPEAARAYLKLPPSLAGVTPLQDGKTGRDLLNEQLDLLLSAVADIMKDAAQAGSQHLLAHQRFLKDRFARPNDELKL